MRKKLPRGELLAVFLLLVFSGLVYFLWQESPFGKFDRFNVVLAGDPVTLVSLGRNQATVVSFPDDLYISEVVPNYGGYKISQVYKVGELDHRGGQVLSWTIGNLLGLPVDGFENDLDVLLKGRFRLTYWLLRQDKIKKIDLGRLAGPLLLADGSTATSLDKEQLDAVLADSFAESRVRDENLRVEVVNSTAAPGLGSRVARVLTNIGATVVNVGSSQDTLSNCEIRTSGKNLGKLTVSRVAQIYSCKIVAGDFESRADVTVVLGADFAKKFNP